MGVTPLVRQSRVGFPCSKVSFAQLHWTDLSSARLRFSEGGGRCLGV
jgi:hypothetical protein